MRFVDCASHCAETFQSKPLISKLHSRAPFVVPVCVMCWMNQGIQNTIPNPEMLERCRHTISLVVRCMRRWSTRMPPTPRAQSCNSPTIRTGARAYVWGVPTAGLIWFSDVKRVSYSIFQVDIAMRGFEQRLTMQQLQAACSVGFKHCYIWPVHLWNCAHLGLVFVCDNRVHCPVRLARGKTVHSKPFSGGVLTLCHPCVRLSW